MIEQVSEKGRELFLSDSIRKSLIVYIYDANDNYIGNLVTTLGDESIVFESMKFDEGVLDGEKLVLGSYISKQISFDRIYDGVSYQNHRCVCVFQDYDENNEVVDRIVLLEGKIFSDVVSNDGNFASVTAYDFLYYFAEKDLSVYSALPFGENTAWGHIQRVCNSLTTNTPYVFFPYVVVSGQANNDENEIVSIFPNATSQINFNISETEKYLFKDFLKHSAEFLGGYIRIPTRYLVSDVDMLTWNFWINFEYLPIDTSFEKVLPKENLYPSNNIFPGAKSNRAIFELPYYINMKFVSQYLTPYNFMYIYKKNELIMGVSATPNLDLQNTYEINDNLFFNFSENLGDDASNVLSLLANIEYPITYVETPYLPFLQSADNLMIRNKEQTFIVPIHKISVSGINAAKCTMDSSANTI
jgi:hypothetical protein